MRFTPVAFRRPLPCRPGSSLVGILAMLATFTLAIPGAHSTTIADDADTAIPLFSSTGASQKLAARVPQHTELSAREQTVNEARRPSKPYTSQPMEDCVLFINGEFVTGPHVVSTDGDRVLVNGVEFPSDETVLWSMQQLSYLELRGGGFGFGSFDPEDETARPRFRKRRRAHDDETAGTENSEDAGDGMMFGARPKAGFQDLPASRIARSVTNMLDSGGRVVHVAFAEHPIVTLPITGGGLELLTALQTNGDDRACLDEALKRLPADTDSDMILDWIHRFQVTPELNDLVQTTAQFLDDVEHRNTKATSAVSRLRAMSYPMSVVGLLLSVFAFGHVVANKPPSRFAPDAAELTPETREMVNRCLLLVVALSLLDLIWTILASQANQMTELNPLGREFIQNPALLGTFKFVMTGLGVGLLFALKQHRIAQTAAWWACMILTLLTMRWLTFNSMFA